MNCKNCGNEFEGNFCNFCGQSSKVTKINLDSFFKEVSFSVFQINRGLFYTFKELLVRPGYTVKDFLAGKRKNHFKPVHYALTLSTLYFIISYLFGENTWMNETIIGISEGTKDFGNGIKLPSILTWFSEHFAYATLFLLPIFSFTSYLSFLRFKTNYLEHIVLNSYIIGQQAFIYTIFVPLKKGINSEFIGLIPIIISIAYAFWMFWQFFDKGSRIKNMLRSVLTYILYFIFCLILLFMLLIIQKN